MSVVSVLVGLIALLADWMMRMSFWGGNRKRDNDNITVRVQVAVSEPFFGWITGLGAKVKILSPKLVANEYQKYLRRILDGYEVED